MWTDERVCAWLERTAIALGVLTLAAAVMVWGMA